MTEPPGLITGDVVRCGVRVVNILVWSGLALTRLTEAGLTGGAPGASPRVADCPLTLTISLQSNPPALSVRQCAVEISAVLAERERERGESYFSPGWRSSYFRSLGGLRLEQPLL